MTADRTSCIRTHNHCRGADRVILFFRHITIPPAFFLLPSDGGYVDVLFDGGPVWLCCLIHNLLKGFEMKSPRSLIPHQAPIRYYYCSVKFKAALYSRLMSPILARRLNNIPRSYPYNYWWYRLEECLKRGYSVDCPGM